MKQQLEKLIQLQDIDTRLAVLSQEAASIPRQIQAATALLDTARRKVEDHRAQLENSSQRKREKERELETREAQLSKARDRQSDIKTNKEYQAHLHGIQTLSTEKGQVEEDLLVLMEEVENIQREGKQFVVELKTAEGEFESAKALLERQLTEIKDQIAVLEKEGQAVAAGLDGPTLRMYQNIRTRRGQAIAPIVKGTCGGCHMNVPPQMVAEAKSREKILACTQCQRLLYWLDPSSNPEVLTRSGSVGGSAGSS